MACITAIVILSQFAFELRRAANTQMRMDFNAETTEFAMEVQHAVTLAIEHTLSVGALFESSSHVTELEFLRYITRSRLLSNYSDIRAIAAIPLLSASELPAFQRALKTREKARRELGYFPFDVKTHPNRDLYAPNTYLESHEGREGVLGFDIASDPTRLATAHAALVSTQPHMTPPIILPQDNGKDIISVQIYASVKNNSDLGLRDASDSNADKATIVSISYSPSITIEKLIVKKTSNVPFNVYVADVTDSTPVTIYGNANNRSEALLIQSSQLVLGGRVWELTMTSTPAVTEAQNSYKSVYSGFIAIALILALTVALDRLIKGRGALESKVHERTEQLYTMNEMLQASAAKASAESDAKSLFLAHMSHELRTPLNAVIGYAQMLKSQLFGELGDKRYLDYAETIESAGNIQLQLVEDILALIALQGGTRELEREHVDLDALAHKCVELVKQKSDENNLTLQITSKLGQEPFLGDERSIQQIIINLLSNAIKFTPPQGRITIRLSRDNLGITSIAVEDTGVGIEAQYIDRVLQPFGQANVNPYNAHEGVGLGLSIVTGLTEASGGRIRIESEPNKGTTVIVEFPPSV